MITPITPPPPPQVDEERSLNAKPKKAWAKPTIRPIEDGVVVTESGANPHATYPESGTYRPQS